jgi:murein DD-endopeptidase MepM/ murein hydrolase activator NlpD
MPKGSATGRGTSIAVIVLAGLAAGCSTDVSRFDFPLLGVTEGSKTPPQANRGFAGATASTDRAGSGDSYRLGGGSAPQATDNTVPVARDGGIRTANLPDVPGERGAAMAAPDAGARAAQARPEPKAEPIKRPPAAPIAAKAAPATGGKTIDVAQGDTLYKIARQHNVSVAALMSANGLTNPNLKPGQKLTIPDGAVVQTNRVPTRAEAAQQRATAAAPAPAAAPAHATAHPAPVAGPDSYTVQAGDSLYAIAKKLHVKSEDLAKANGITDPAKIRQGQVLKVPGAGGAVSAAPAAPAKPAAPAPLSAQRPAAGNAKVAGIGNTAVLPAQPIEQGSTAGNDDAVAPAAGGKAEPVKAAPVAEGGFRWPVKGKVIQKFGPKDDGTHNDGINIAVPAGTDVQAAEGGTVAYAGNELKGYGNLILIRHDENWVSAYAHNDTLLVKRGDKIKRGQVIAKAGKSGTVDQPQVHFELRQGSKPVDPMKHLASN